MHYGVGQVRERVDHALPDSRLDNGCMAGYLGQHIAGRAGQGVLTRASSRFEDPKGYVVEGEVDVPSLWRTGCTARPQWMANSDNA